MVALSCESLAIVKSERLNGNEVLDGDLLLQGLGSLKGKTVNDQPCPMPSLTFSLMCVRVRETIGSMS